MEFGFSSSLTITNSLSSIKVVPSAYSTTTSTSFSVQVDLIGEDGDLYKTSSTVTLAEKSSTAISGSSSQTGATGSFTFSGLTFSSAGVKLLRATSGSITGDSSITISDGNTVTLSYEGNLIVNHYIKVWSFLRDASSNLVTGSKSGTLTGNIGGTTTGSSSTGVISYSVYLTATGSQTITVDHDSITNTLDLTISQNTAVITPSKVWAQEPDTLTYEIYLKYAPAASEVISITVSDSSQFTLSASSLTFSAANTAQTVTVTVSDTTLVGSTTKTISHSNSNLDFTSSASAISSGVFTVTIYDATSTYVVMSSAPAMQEGGSASTSFYLSAAPTSNVVVTFDADSSLTLSPTTLTFTSSNYGTAQSVSITSSVTSENESGTNTYAITFTTSSSDNAWTSPSSVPTTFNVYVIKTSNPSVLISESVVFQESLGGSYSIVLTSEPTSSVTVSLSSSGSEIKFSPTIASFDSSNYDTPQTITLSTVTGSTPRYLKYSIDIVHTVTSGDSNYNGITAFPSDTVTVTAVHPCKAGLYAWPPGSGTCELCPLGYECPTLYEDSVACSEGEYSPLGVWNCIKCPPGFECSGSTMPIPCPDGETSAEGVGVCSSCSGVPCDLSGGTIASAPNGFYLAKSGHSMYICPPGYYCTGGSASPVACSSGYYSTIGSSSCTQCPSGYYCPDPATPIPIPCDPFSYSSAGSLYCNFCPVGYSCTASGKTACTSAQISLEGWMECITKGINYIGGGTTGCGLGYYYVSSTCTTCTAGYECDGVFRRPCSPGWYSSSGASVCTQCSLGSYANSVAATSCTTISTAGQFSNLINTGFGYCHRGLTTDSPYVACRSCTAGNQCDDPASPTTCAAGHVCFPIGTSQNSGTNQHPCPSGFYYSSTGGDSFSDCIACTAGSYCHKGTSSPITCPKGHYCPAYSWVPDNFPCPKGKIQTSTGMDDVSDCTDCTAGYYCYQGGTTEFQCTDGYYCPTASNYPFWCSPGYTSAINSDDSSDCSICAAGYFCPPGSYKWPCIPGTYNPSTGGGFLWDACTLCPAGSSCTQYGQTSGTAYACSKGHYCPIGTEYSEQYPCPAGTYTESTGLASYIGCTSTELGYYSTIGSTSTDRVLCPRGHYCPVSSPFSHGNPCSAGKFVWTLGSDDSNDCGSCTAGKYCVRGASYESGRCSQGFYCPAGSSFPDDETNACAAGKFMAYFNATSSSDCVDCPPGSFCVKSSAHPLPCPPGYYSTSAGASSCTQCSAGYYCPTGSSLQTICPNGYYASAGSYECDKCAGGYYCASGSKTACVAGKYCPEGSSSETTCPVGYYCLATASSATPCSAGKIRSTTGGTAASSCTDVAAGYYSVLGSSAATGKCEPGYYCMDGSAGPYATPCSAGTYRRAPGGASSSDCIDCPAGYYCKLGTANPVTCPVGYYCVASTSTPVFCPSGTVGESEGLEADTDCTDCPEGSFCSQPGLLVADGVCAPGYICEAGSDSSSGGDTSCPSGGYCQPGFITQRACPPGTYNPDTGAKDVTKCGNCDPGYYCYGDETAYGENECAAGYYCPVGSYWAKMNISPPGYYSVAAESEATVCEIGTFNRLYAQSECTACIEGFYCDEKEMIEPTICPEGYYCEDGVEIYSSCPAGTFNPREGLTTQDDCQYCTPGYYCLKAALTGVTGLCDPGYYCTFGSSTKKPTTYSSTDGDYGQCPAGSYCEQGSPLPVKCPTGTYNPDLLASSESECLPCDEGSYCTNTGLSDVEGDCYAGYYCPSGSTLGVTVPRPTEGSSELNYCTYGKYCETGSSEPSDVPQGYYQDELRQSTYKQCPAGFYCVEGTGDFDSFLCPQGYYCPEGTEFANQYPCPQGTYNPKTGSISETECLDCPPGYFCSTAGKYELDDSTDLCAGGYFCKRGSKLQEPIADYPGDDNGGRCVKGYYCPEGSAYALKCDAGKYCGSDLLLEVSGDCDAGYYCISGATTKTPTDGTTGDKCPKGHYCPAGSQSPIPCPKGTYNGLYSSTSDTACSSCPPKYYCGGAGLAKATGLCSAGFYCSGGNYEKMPASGKCTAGHYCPEGSSAEKNCVVGYYQDRTLQSACKKCPEGYYCSSEETVDPTFCEAGYYCPEASTDHLPCAAGTYSNVEGRIKASQCTNCPPGKYCLGGKSAPDGDCTAGYYCLGAATKASPTEDAEGGICPKGFYCPAGSTSAIKCTPGMYCNAKGLSEPFDDCLAGYYCLEGSTTNKPTDGIVGAICPAGYYCPTGSAYPSPCAIGKYQPTQGKTSSSDCLDCPAGYYCSSKASKSFTGTCGAGYYCPTASIKQKNPSNICPQGSYCPAGASTSTVCAEGTYQDQKGQSTCKDCPAGYYCEEETVTPIICEAGYMCPTGTSYSTMQPCHEGNYNPFVGQSECFVCPRGYYCKTDLTGITTPVECEIYSYCPEGTSSSSNPCIAGTYTDETGLQSKDQCKQCPAGFFCKEGKYELSNTCDAGYYCVSGSNTATPDSYTNKGIGSPCPIGNYCPKGTVVPTPCPDGKTRSQTGGKTVDDCTECEAGYYCIANDPVPKSCPTGAYCPQGSSTPSLCPEGYYSTQTQASSENVCTICPSGYICSRAGIGDYRNFPCSPGYYCPAGSLLPVRAPEGYYSPGSTAGAISDLNDCPEGNYCEEMSTGYTKCSVGTYCPTGSSQPTACSLGYFCDYVSSEPTHCPIGWYCGKYEYPMDDYPPLLCPEGTICPLTTSSGSVSGSNVYTYCNAGKYAIMAKNINDDETTSCETCPPGMYSLVGWIECKYCDAGYVCLGGTIIPNPTVRDLHNGYECGVGYYCPSGTTDPIPCPAGTFSLNYTLGSLDECEPCPKNQFSDKAASTECKVCGDTSTSKVGSTSCTCIGSNRVYLKEKKSCACKAGFEYQASDGTDESDLDSTNDCTEIVYDRCQVNDVRDDLGDCRSKTDCADFCNGGKGTRSVSTGACQCEDVVDLNSICDTKCLNDSPQYSLAADNSIVRTDTDGTTESVKVSELEGFFGSLDCESSSCKIVSMNFNEKFQGEYGVSTVIESSRRDRRRLDDSNTYLIENPVVCISEGDSMIFSVKTPKNYPIYLKDSLLNSNPDFDYSEFTSLAENITAGATVSVFGFTFKDAGIYIFADKANKDQTIIIGVMSSDQQCPFGSGYIQPRLTSSLHLLGVKLDDNITLTVDWTVVYGVMAFLVFTVLAFAGFFYYYSLLVWSVPPLVRIEYREENQVLEIQDDVGPRNTKKVIIEGREADSSGSEAEEIQGMVNEKVPESADYEIPSEKDGNNLIDAALMQSIKDKIRENNGMFRKFMEDNDAETAERLQRLEQETENLKNLMESLLNPIRPTYRKPMTAASSEYHQEGHFNHLSSEGDYQEAMNEIAINKELLEQDKQKLMSELNSEMSKLDNNLKLEKSKHDADLSKKLAERALKRKELEKKKLEVEADEKLLAKKHQNEKKFVTIDVENEEVQLEHEINEDKFDMARKLHGQKAIELQNRLREGVAINPEKQQDMLRQYETEIQALDKNLSMNQIRQQQELARKIEEKKRQRKAQIAEMKAKKAAELEARQRAEIEELNQRKMEIEAQEIVASVMPVFLQNSNEDPLRDLEFKQKKEIEEAEKLLKDQEEQEMSKVFRNSSINESKLTQQKLLLEKQRRDLMNSVESATEEDRDEILNDLRKTEQRLKELAEEQSLEQKKNLDTRLEIRRKKREEKLREIKDKQEKEKEKIEKELREKTKTERASSLENAIKEAMGKLPEDQKAKAIQAMLEEKHENEQLELNKKLKKKLRDRQKHSIQEVMNLKIKDMELLRNEFKEKAKAAGRDAETTARIQKEENEALAKLDYYYMKKLEKMQEDDWKDQQKKNQEELLALIDQQLSEMRKHLHKKDPNTQELEAKIKRERDEIEKEGKDKLEFLDKQKKELEEQRAQKQKEIEDMIRKEKEREERDRIKKEVQDRKRATMERQKKEREELLRKGQMTKEQMDKLIADHQRELNALEMAIARERERQIGMMSQKIAEKEARKREYESSMQRMKEEQDRLQKELEELPGITNKQATTLLLKWRRYPKKNLKDIEKSVKSNEPAHKVLPIVNKNTGKQGKKIENKRLEELIWRIEKIEGTVDHVNTEQIGNIFKSLKKIEDRVKTLKK